jgi:methyl acetate hydrolase
MLGGGAIDGTRILSASTVHAAFQNQIGDLDFPASIATVDPASAASFNVGPGYKWGYGLLVNSAGVPGGRKAGSGASGGLYNTHFRIDPAAGITGAMYTQCLPFAAEENMRLYGDFERAIYASR